MFRSFIKVGAPIGALGLALSLGGLRSAEAAGECSANSLSSCDLQEESTLMRARLWSTDCERPNWDQVLTEGYPFQSDPRRLAVGPRAPVNFLNGACHFHKAITNPSYDPSLGISELEKAQTVGLLPSQKNVAALFEGLLHCQQLSAIRAKNTVEQIRNKRGAREAFCKHRSMAKASFSDVRWTGLRLAYEKVSPFHVMDHIEKMSTCHADYLNGEFDSVCGVVSSLDDQTVRGVASQAAKGVLEDYFGAEGGAGEAADASQVKKVPPLKAMLARKLKMANDAVAGSEETWSSVQKKSDSLTASYVSLDEHYCTATGSAGGKCIPGSVVALEKAYSDAVLRAQDVLGFVERWVNGFYEYQGKDVRAELGRSREALTGSLVKLEERRSRTNMSLADEVGFVRKELGLLATSNEAAHVQAACRIYFCEVRGLIPKYFREACKQQAPGSSQTIGQTNKLCEADVVNTVVKDTPRTTAFDICKRAGFDEALMNRRQWTPAQVNACVEALRP